MGIKPEQPLNMDEHDAASFKVYLKYRNYDRQGTLDLMKQWFRKKRTQTVEPISILSVGSGPGEFDVAVAQQLAGLLMDEQTLRYIALEPNRYHRDEITAKFAALSTDSIAFEGHNITYEDFQSDKKFDLIHFTQSLYHMSGAEEATIRKALAMLNTSGILVIVIDTEDAGMFKLVQKHGEVTNFTLLPPGVDFANASIVRNVLVQMGLSFEQVDHPGEVNVTPCFDPENQEGVYLLNFLCITNFAALTPGQQTVIREYLSTLVTEKAGEYFLTEPMVTFAIDDSKPNGPGS